MDTSVIFNNITSLLDYSPESPMLFSGGLFWALFLLFIPIYASIKSRKTQMLVFTVAFSLYFYFKSSGYFFLLLVCTSIVDWLISHRISKASSRLRKRIWLTLSILISVSVLGYFKYANFFLWNWNQMVEGNFQPLDIILPVGISFYT
ncbi:MAG: MBOAT family protein, partial [Muribaculaceae bacterium]|nr:MBOAT family protein [Muribaculaceae bacterium]